MKDIIFRIINNTKIGFLKNTINKIFHAPNSGVIIGGLLLAIILRTSYIFWFHPPEKYIYSDMKGYYERAQNFVNNAPENIGDTIYPPGTHYLYGICFLFSNSFLFIKILNIILGVATCLFIFLGTKLLFDQKSAIIALYVAALNFLFIDLSGYLMSETPFAFSLSVMFFAYLQSILHPKTKIKISYACLAGLFTAISASFKSVVLFFVPLFAIWWLFSFRKYKIFVLVFFYFLGFLPLMGMMSYRIHQLSGKFGIECTNGGFNFFIGRSHINEIRLIDHKRGLRYAFASPVAVQKKYSYNDTFQVGPYESEYFIDKAIQEVKKDIPRTFLYSLEYIFNLFYSTVVWPSCCIGGWIPPVVEYFNIFFVWIVIVPSLIFFFIKFKAIIFSPLLLVYIPIFNIFLVAAIFFAEPRHRIPYDVFFIMIFSYIFRKIFLPDKNQA